jgi:tetratricopeptide (TPR) repeat protein
MANRNHQVFILGMLFFAFTLQATGIYGQARPTLEQVNIEKKIIDGKKYAMLGDLEKAETIFKSVLAEDLQNSTAYYELSRTYAATDRLPEALDHIRKAIRIEPDNEWFLLMEADIHEKNNDLFSSMEIYERLIALRPDRPHYFEMLIAFCKRTGEEERLLTTLDKYEKLTGLTESITRNRFETLDGLGRTNDALAAIHRLTEVYPKNIEYKYLAASYCRTKGLNDKALIYYRQIIDIDPSDSRARLALAGSEKEDGNKAGYLQSILPIISNPSLSIDVKLQELIPYVLEYSEKKDPSLGAALIDVTQQLVNAHPTEAKAYAVQGDVFSIQDKKESAISAYLSSTRFNDKVYTVWEQIITLLIDTYEYDRVVTQAHNAMEIFPNQAYLYYAAGYGAYKQKDFSEALDMLSQALIMTGKNIPQKISVYNVLGLVYDELGQPDKSIEAFETALGLNPRSAETLSQYSLVLSRRIEQSEKAIDMADRLLSEGNHSAQVHQWIAEVFYNQKKYSKANQSIQVALQKGTDAQGYNLAGDILVAMGETDKALEMWQTAMSKGYPDAELKKKLADHKTQ